MISKLSAWSSRYYVETARTAAAGLGDDSGGGSGGGLGEYYSESETRLPTWLVAGRDVAAVRELTGVGVSGAAADMDAVTTWLEEGVAPSGASGRAFVDATETSDSYEIIVERHRTKTTIVTSNRDPAEWLTMTADTLLAQSAIDRLTANAHTLVVEGPSYRQRNRPGRPEVPHTRVSAK